MSRIVLSAPVRFGPEELVERFHATDWSALLRARPDAIDGPAFSFELAWTGPDPRLEAAFRAAIDPQRPTLSERELHAIAGHAHIVRVAGPVATSPEGSLAAAEQAQLVAAALLDAGALGVKCDSSGLAHGHEGWTSLVSRTRQALQQHHAGDADAVFPMFGGLIDTFVRRPVMSGGWWRTRGLHLLGRAEVALPRAALPSDAKAIRLLDAFSLYLCAEAPPDELADGHTFRVSPESPRFLLRHLADDSAEDHLFYSVRGTWELVPEA